VWWYVFVHWRDIHVPSVLLSKQKFRKEKVTETMKSVVLTHSASYGVCILLSLKKINERWFKKYPLPHAFFLMSLTIPLSYILTKKKWAHVSLVGTIPQGFPSFSLINVHAENTFAVIKQAITYSIFYFIIHITIAKTVAEQQHVTVCKFSR
jgi:MFS superfamily sulfate permease-like transporter